MTKALSNEQLIGALNWRYAVKKFDATKKISKDDWTTLEKTLVLTPSSYGLQPWKFLVIQNPDLRKKLTPLSWNQTQVEDCSHFVVFAVLKKLSEADIERFIQQTAKVRGAPAAAMDGYKNMMIGDLVKGPRSNVIREWAARQTYIALGNFMTAAAVLGIDTCPMEGLDPGKYDEVLGLNDSPYATVVACPAGYRHAEDKYAQMKKVRFDVESVIEHR